MKTENIIKMGYKKPFLTITYLIIFIFFILEILHMGYDISYGEFAINRNKKLKDIGKTDVEIAPPIDTTIVIMTAREVEQRNYKKEIKNLEKLLLPGQYARAYRESLAYFDTLPQHYKTRVEQIIEEAEVKYDNGKFTEAARILINELRKLY
jgi:predicted RND superfamily exporter protein